MQNLKKKGGKIIVFGIGNKYRCDDVAGLLVSEKLKTKNFQQAKIISLNDDLSSMLLEWRNADGVIIADAVFSNSKPGTIFRFNLLTDSIPRKKFKFSTHHISLTDSIRLARQLSSLPAELRLFAIEGKTFDTGISLTGEVAEAVEIVAGEISELCLQWLADE